MKTLVVIAAAAVLAGCAATREVREPDETAAAPLGIEVLARVPEAAIVVVGPLPEEARRALATGPVWKALPAAKAGRVAVLPPVNHYGGLPAARRFARLLAAADV